MLKTSPGPIFLLGWFGLQAIFELPIITQDEYLQELEATTPEMIQNLAQKYLSPDSGSLAVIGSSLSDNINYPIAKI